MPITATFPETADCQLVPSVAARCRGRGQRRARPAAGGVPDDQRRIGLERDADIASHVEGVAWVTVYPATVRIVVSGAVVSPFCSSTSTGPS